MLKVNNMQQLRNRNVLCKKKKCVLMLWLIGVLERDITASTTARAALIENESTPSDQSGLRDHQCMWYKFG